MVCEMHFQGYLKSLNVIVGQEYTISGQTE